MKVKVGISNRHVHLSKEVKDILFGDDYELTVRNDLSQTGEFASNEMVTVKTEKGIIPNVRILGPLRNYVQVEISKTDAYKLGLNPPVRNSEDIAGSESAILVGPKGEYNVKEGVIIATRHIHISREDAGKYSLSEKHKLKARISGEKPGVIEEINVKINDNYNLELHLDTDDGNAFLLKTGDEVEIFWEE